MRILVVLVAASVDGRAGENVRAGRQYCIANAYSRQLIR
jgi:hypothetical protein